MHRSQLFIFISFQCNVFRQEITHMIPPLLVDILPDHKVNVFVVCLFQYMPLHSVYRILPGSLGVRIGQIESFLVCACCQQWRQGQATYVCGKKCVKRTNCAHTCQHISYDFYSLYTLHFQMFHWCFVSRSVLLCSKTKKNQTSLQKICSIEH